jgi:hypothetical protein
VLVLLLVLPLLPSGVALTVYFSMGLFGASLFGQDTEGNIMVNELVTGRAATAALYGIMLLYLALGMTTTQYALRASLDLMVFGDEATFTWTRQVSTNVAACLPGKSLVSCRLSCTISVSVTLSVVVWHATRGMKNSETAACRQLSSELAA